MQLNSIAGVIFQLFVIRITRAYAEVVLYIVENLCCIMQQRFSTVKQAAEILYCTIIVVFSIH